MKTLLTILIAVISLKSYAQVLYCGEDRIVGIKGSTNKIIEFKPQKFTIEVDIKNLKMYSKELYFAKQMPQTIHCFKDEETLMCSNSFGVYFVLHLDDYAFTYSFLPVVRRGGNYKGEDDYTISRGNCEKF